MARKKRYSQELTQTSTSLPKTYRLRLEQIAEAQKVSLYHLVRSMLVKAIDEYDIPQVPTSKSEDSGLGEGLL